jgi:hypothetical protein
VFSLADSGVGYVTVKLNPQLRQRSVNVIEFSRKVPEQSHTRRNGAVFVRTKRFAAASHFSGAVFQHISKWLMSLRLREDE